MLKSDLTILVFLLSGMVTSLTAVLWIGWHSVARRIDAIENRLRSLGHEDRDIRSQIMGLAMLCHGCPQHLYSADADNKKSVDQ